MMETLFVIFALWGFITLIGHGTWVVVRAVFRLIAADQPGVSNANRLKRTQGSSSEKTFSAASDLNAFRRMVDALNATEKVSAEDATRWKDLASDLVLGPIPPVAKPSEAKPVAAPAVSREPNPFVEPPPIADEPEVAEPVAVANPIAVAEVVAEPATPQRALSEIITSFLARNNIRWGELVAGLLVVVCSIGLVVSLWNTLTSFRLLPTLIFMTADAAIFAAGLYTMRRWRLRHTSRAVLIIATLLVPLCVLAGMAAAGANLESVSLADPGTLGTIVVGLLGCGWLLLQSSRCLVGRADAVALTASVIAPTLSLPLLPTAARLLGDGAGWFVLAPATCVAIALLWPRRMRSIRESASADRTVSLGGRRLWKNRWLSLGIASASMSAVLVYAAFLLRDATGDGNSQSAWIQIAIASIPFWVAIAAGCVRDALAVGANRRLATAGMVASVLSLLSLGVVALILPASIGRLDWLWMHSIVAAASWCVASLTLRRPSQSMGAVLPLGLAAMLSSPSWLGGTTWGDLPIWRSVLGGEPMVVAVGLASLAGMAAFAFRRMNSNPWGMMAAGWGVLGVVQAIVLSFAPGHWLGVVPAMVVHVVLGLAGLGCVLASSRDARVSWLTPVALVAFWASVLALVQWTDERVLVNLAVVPWIGLSVATCLVGAAALLRNRWIIEGLVASSTTTRLASNRGAVAAGGATCLSVAALAGTTVGALASEDFVGSSWWPASGLLWASTALLLAVAWLMRHRGWLQASMVLSPVAVIVTATSLTGLSVWSSDAWASCEAVWLLAGLLAVSSAIWMGLRRVPRSKTPWSLVNQNEASLNWNAMPDGWTLLIGIGAMLFAVARQYAAVLVGPMELLSGWSPSDWFAAHSFGWADSLANLSLMGAAAGMVAASRNESSDTVWKKDHWQTWLGGLAAAAGLFVAAQLSIAWTDSTTLCLVVTTTLAAAIALLWKFVPRWLGKTSAASRQLIHVIVAVLITLGSVVLLITGWFAPLADGVSPDRIATLSVCGWWVLASLGLLFSKQDRLAEQIEVARTNSLLSAVLMPMAVGFAVPAIFRFVPFANEALVWVQLSVIGSAVWWLLNRFATGSLTRSTAAVRDPTLLTGATLSLGWLVVIGVASCAGAIASVWWLPSSRLAAGDAIWTLPVGGLVSLVAVIVAMVRSASPMRDAWPFAVSLLAGHIAVVTAWLGVCPADAALVTMSGVWLLALVGSAMVHVRKNMPMHAWHLTLLTTVLLWLALFELPVMPNGTWWLSLIAFFGLCVAGVASIGFGRTDGASDSPATWQWVLPRVIGWMVVLAGGFLVWDRLLDHVPGIMAMDSTAIWLAWMAIWVLVWRIASRWFADGESRGLADLETACLMVPVALVGWAESVDRLPMSMFQTNTAIGLLNGFMPWFAIVLVAASAMLRPLARTVWTTGTLLSLVALGEAGVWVASLFGLASMEGLVVAHIAIASGLIAWAFGASWMRPADVIEKVAVTLERLTLGWVLFSSLIPLALLYDTASVTWIRISLLTTGALAWVFYQLAEANLSTLPARTNRRRHQAVGVVLWSLALLAVAGGIGESHPELVATMRLLIASVLAIGVMLLAIPKLLGGPFLDRWKDALTRGGLIAGVGAIGSLVVMLAVEAAVRTPIIGIPDLDMPLVVAVGLILGGLAAMAGVLAVLTGPGSKLSMTLTDAQRKWLLYFAQGIAATTWLHLFLCRTGIAFLGLRQVWPYIVMLIAFVSVGLTQWALRRGDRVMSDVMRRTSMFLPMIPVVGFWLSGSYAVLVQSDAWSWTFFRGTASYQGLLVVGAIYYGMISLLWKNGLPRVATVVLANAALWVTLTQIPGWDFLTHPQAWLIPPAVCVLAVAHWYRDRLDESVGSAIRYASTLVIYLSSTADMLLSEIGSSLSGPIILVLLALAGMAAGVVLRVKPFLYLGTIFVFLGVTSMVWHSTQAIDAVWPWWVFGITSGLLLLTGLAMIEKNRPRLSRWAGELATWES